MRQLIGKAIAVAEYVFPIPFFIFSALWLHLISPHTLAAIWRYVATVGAIIALLGMTDFICFVFGHIHARILLRVNPTMVLGHVSWRATPWAPWWIMVPTWFVAAIPTTVLGRYLLMLIWS